MISTGLVRGLLMLGDILDSGAARQIQDFTGRNVLLYSGGASIGQANDSTVMARISPQELRALGEVMAEMRFAHAVALPFPATIGGQKCLVSILPLSNGQEYTILFRAFDEVYRQMNDIRLLILAGSALAIILAAILSMALSAKLGHQPATRRVNGW